MQCRVEIEQYQKSERIKRSGECQIWSDSSGNTRLLPVEYAPSRLIQAQLRHRGTKNQSLGPKQSILHDTVLSMPYSALDTHAAMVTHMLFDYDEWISCGVPSLQYSTCLLCFMDIIGCKSIFIGSKIRRIGLEAPKGIDRRVNYCV